jgi:hypothetical protein
MGRGFRSQKAEGKIKKWGRADRKAKPEILNGVE